MTANSPSVPLNCETLTLNQNESFSNEISIYPNPFSSSFKIELSEKSLLDESEFTLFSILGEKIISLKLTQKSTEFENRNLKPGVYMYQIRSKENIVKSGKLIAQ